MRIDKFNLWRYGKFTDYVLDFGDYAQNPVDLHIVYGPNEAGKSTLMEAYMDFLYGFPTKTEQAFIHDRTTLKLGASLTIENKPQDFVRLKKQKNSLVDSNESPIEEQVLTKHLSGLSRTSYINMFSLDDRTLEEGGKSILASEGDLGKLLYSATTGVAQLSESLQQLHDTTAAFYKKGKRKYELAELKNALKEIDAERKEIDTQASAYAKLVKEKDEAEANYQACGKKLDANKLHIQKLILYKGAHPRLNTMYRLQAELKPYEALPDSPPAGVEELRQIKHNNIEIETRNTGFTEKLSALDSNIDSIDVDYDALNLKSQWSQIVMERDNYLVARTNLPDIEQQLSACHTEIKSSLNKLGRQDTEQPQSLVFSTAKQAQFMELIQQQPRLMAALNSAKVELDSAQLQHTQQSEKLEQQSGQVDDSTEFNVAQAQARQSALEELSALIATFSNADLASQFKVKSQQLDSIRAQLNTSLTSLKPWTGDAIELNGLRVPHGTDLQRLLNDRDELSASIKSEQNNLTTINEKLADVRSQIASYSATGIVDDAQITQLRKARDEAWLEHRNTLDANSADKFERAMHADDVGIANRQTQTESLALLNQLKRDELAGAESLKRAAEKLEKLAEEQQSNKSATSSLIAQTSEALRNVSIESFLDWLQLREKTLTHLNAITELERELGALDLQAQNHCDELSNTLKRSGTNIAVDATHTLSVDNLAKIIRECNNVLKHETRLQGLREQHNATAQNLKSREFALEKAQESITEWQTHWNDACKSSWIGDTDSVPTIQLVEGILQELNTLDASLKTQSNLEDKRKFVQSNLDSFHQVLLEHANTLSIASNDQSTDELYLAAQERFDSATNAHSAMADAQNQKNALLEEQKENSLKLSVNQQRISGLSTYFDVTSIDDIESKLQDVYKKKALTQQLEAEQEQLTSMLNTKSLAEAVNLLGDFDADSAQLQLDELNREQQELEQDLQSAHTIRENARKTLESIGGDEAVAVLNEKRENTLLQIEEKTTRYLELRLALIAADAALKSYRDNHRSSMMKKASDAFAKISCGRYVNLETYQDGTTESLRAIDEHGIAKQSHQLSKGTRFQLYLALRIAGYFEYATSSPTVPFIADDIMETFDDERVEQTFAVLGDMAKVGQVIYLTHHQHLCDIAKRAVPNSVIHELG